MVSEPVQIVQIVLRSHYFGRSEWRIDATDRRRYTTHSRDLMTRCEQAKAQGASVRLESYGGSYYRDLVGVRDAL